MSRFAELKLLRLRNVDSRQRPVPPLHTAQQLAVPDDTAARSCQAWLVSFFLFRLARCKMERLILGDRQTKAILLSGETPARPPCLGNIFCAEERSPALLHTSSRKQTCGVGSVTFQYEAIISHTELRGIPGDPDCLHEAIVAGSWKVPRTLVFSSYTRRQRLLSR